MIIPKYKLTYFNSKGIPEPIRFMFVLADEPFIDNRIERDENWDNINEEYPWNELPVLEVEGITISKTCAIARFLARRFGLVGKNEFEASKCDEIIDTLFDFRTDFQICSNAPEAIKPEMMKQLHKIHVPNYFKKLNEIIKINYNGNGWIVGESITWADLYIAYFFISFDEITQTQILNSYKHIKKLKNQVFSFPSIMEYSKTHTEINPTLE